MVLKEISFAFFFTNILLTLSLFYLYFRSLRNIDFLYAAIFFLSSSIFLFGQYGLFISSTAQAFTAWDRFRHIGIFTFTYSMPMLSSTIINRKITRAENLGLGILVSIIVGLVIFSPWVISNQTVYLSTGMRSGRGILYTPFMVLEILIIGYFYIQLIKAHQNKSLIRLRDYLPNVTPAIVGLGFGFCCGVLDVLGLIRGKPTIPGATWPFILFGVTIISLSYVWTFLSRYSRFFVALREAHEQHDRLIERYNRNFLEFVWLIAETLDAKDHYTAGHALRVRDYSVKIARVLNLPDSQITLLEQAALLHDIGKISIPDGILNKKSALTTKEREHIYRHPVVARKILSTVSDFQEILDIIYNHHERIDGQGYPEGRKKEEIPLLSRIIAVADTYDAMLSERPYRRAKTKDEALKELDRVKGKQLDESIVDKFISLETPP